MSGLITIELVKARFEDWRAKKDGKKGRTPDHLRNQAVELAKTHSRSKVIKELKINGSMLKEWERVSRPADKQSPKFFEMKIPNDLPETVPSAPANDKQSREMTLTLTGKNDLKATLSGNFSMTEISSLAKSFLGGES